MRGTSVKSNFLGYPEETGNIYPFNGQMPFRKINNFIA